MLTGAEVRRRGQPWGMTLSFALHLAALAILMHRPAPVFVNPQSVQLGDGPKSYHVVYVPQGAEASDQPDTIEHNPLALHASVRKPRVKPTSVKPKEAPTPNPQGEVADRNAHAGTVYGSIWALMQEGHDVKPAIPIVYPSPDFSSIDWPSGLQADVVVEVTIERDGSVVDMKLIQSVGRGVDEKVIAAVRNWRFRPAILDGTPIASKHDVHFHLPS
jgi:TonB family protein